MADVHLPRSLAALFPGTPRRLRASGATLADLIDDLDVQVPGLRNRIVDAGPAIRTHINVFVAGERATLATPVPPDATVHVIPAVSGGEERFVPAVQAEARPSPFARAADFPEAGDHGPIHDPRALQILSTEHWSLLTARSLVYNETFARGGMFLALLSASLVGLGLISTATGFSDAFLSVAVVVLTMDLFVGLATLGRINAASDEDLRCLQGMNRLRHAYFEIVPGLERYFITSGFDDFNSVLAMYGPQDPSGRVRDLLHGFTTMPGMIAVICSGLVGVLVAVQTLLVTHDSALAGWLALASALVFFVGSAVIAIRMVFRFKKHLRPVFPAPGQSEGPPRG